IWDWDLVSNAQWWNEGLYTLFGFRPEEVAPIFDWWANGIHPEDRERVLKSIHESISHGSAIWSAEYRFMRKDGSYADVLDRGYLIRDAALQPLRMIGCMTDLTERMRAAERIAEQAALLDKARDAILVRGLDHRISYCNKSAERLYGWSAVELLGASVRDILYKDPAVFDVAMREVLEHGEWVGELVQLCKDGRKLTIEGRWTLVRDESGAPRAVLAINTDISERKKLEQQFFRAQRMESIGTLAGGIAHDLNNALAPIVIGLDLLKMRFTEARDQSLLAMIGASAERGAAMVRQVLSFARGVEGERVEIAIGKLIGEIEKIANETFLKHIHVRTRVAADLHTLLGDPTQLHQVLLNLCVNARDAMPDGGTITISAENVVFDAHGDAKPGPYILLEVEDTGAGIAPGMIEKIFDPFFTTKAIGQGTGLGLSSSLAIVKSHGGFIQVESEESKGAVFKIYLPAQLEKSHMLATRAEPEMPRGNGEKILLIDDELMVREVTKQTLETYGYVVVVARDGVEAIGIFGQEYRAISAVVIDMMMPVMDGPETIQVLLKIDPEIPVIAASGFTISGHFARASALGVKHFLSKPYTAEMLLTALRQVLPGKGKNSSRPVAWNLEPHRRSE
ncbi:MAG: multi-sensor hybrid histidine kinase, partial [Chthoniobacteraceae bacterium]|nr:multi-sensor hybrid histidine kinase [Chthoniobacteraceae bacterium]